MKTLRPCSTILSLLTLFGACWFTGIRAFALGGSGAPEIDPNAIVAEIYVDPAAGQDTNSGSSPSAPKRTLLSAWQRALQLNSNNQGARILLAPGTYREGAPGSKSVFIGAPTTSAPIVLQGQGWTPGSNTGDVILTGSEPWSGWVAQGGGVWSAPWPDFVQLPLESGLPFGDPETIVPIPVRQMGGLFVNGQQYYLFRSATDTDLSRLAPDEGGWWIDDGPNAQRGGGDDRIFVRVPSATPSLDLTAQSGRINHPGQPSAFLAAGLDGLAAHGHRHPQPRRAKRRRFRPAFSKPRRPHHRGLRLSRQQMARHHHRIHPVCRHRPPLRLHRQRGTNHRHPGHRHALRGPAGREQRPPLLSRALFRLGQRRVQDRRVSRHHLPPHPLPQQLGAGVVVRHRQRPLRVGGLGHRQQHQHGNFHRKQQLVEHRGPRPKPHGRHPQCRRPQQPHAHRRTVALHPWHPNRRNRKRRRAAQLGRRQRHPVAHQRHSRPRPPAQQPVPRQHHRFHALLPTAVDEPVGRDGVAHLVRHPQRHHRPQPLFPPRFLLRFPRPQRQCRLNAQPRPVALRPPEQPLQHFGQQGRGWQLYILPDHLRHPAPRFYLALALLPLGKLRAHSRLPRLPSLRQPFRPAHRHLHRPAKCRRCRQRHGSRRAARFDHHSRRATLRRHRGGPALRLLQRAPRAHPSHPRSQRLPLPPRTKLRPSALGRRGRLLGFRFRRSLVLPSLGKLDRPRPVDFHAHRSRPRLPHHPTELLRHRCSRPRFPTPARSGHVPVRCQHRYLGPHPIDNTQPQVNRTLTVAVLPQSGSYGVVAGQNSSTITILDNDILSHSSIEESVPVGGGPVTVTLTLYNPSGSTTNFTLSPPSEPYSWTASSLGTAPAYDWVEIINHTDPSQNGTVIPGPGTYVNWDNPAGFTDGLFTWFVGGYQNGVGYSGGCYRNPLPNNSAEASRGSDTLPLGFTFPFYGQNYSAVHLHTNGFLSLVPDPAGFEWVSFTNRVRPKRWFATSRGLPSSDESNYPAPRGALAGF